MWCLQTLKGVRKYFRKSDFLKFLKVERCEKLKLTHMKLVFKAKYFFSWNWRKISWNHMPMSYSKTCDNKCKYDEFWNKILEDFVLKLKTLKLFSWNCLVQKVVKYFLLVMLWILLWRVKLNCNSNTSCNIFEKKISFFTINGWDQRVNFQELEILIFLRIWL